MPNGGYVYWYPSDGGGRGRFSTEKHKEDKKGLKNLILSIFDEMLPPDKKPYIVRMEELLSQAEDDSPEPPKGEETPKEESEEGEETQKEESEEGEETQKEGEETPSEIPSDETAENRKIREELEAERKTLRDAAAKATMEKELVANRAAITALARMAPGMTDDEIKQLEASVERRFGNGGSAEAAPGDDKDKLPGGKPAPFQPPVDKKKVVQDVKAASLFQHLVDELIKARATKYIRRVPTGNPKRPWRYFYAESSSARAVQEGETLQLGDLKVEISKVDDDGTVHLRWPEVEATMTYAPNEWSKLLTKHYGSVYIRSAERRARQSANAVLRLVPKAMLEDLTGDTDKERLADLKKRAPKVYAKLKKAFSRAGMGPVESRRVIADTLQARGWDAEARAALLGNVLDSKGAWLAKNYRRVQRSAENSLNKGERVSAAHVQAAVDILAPGGPLEERDKLEDTAGKELKQLEKLLQEAQGDPSKAVRLLKKALASPSLAKIHAMHRAHPELEIKHGEESAEIVRKVGAVHPRMPGTVGSPTQVYVAGTNGQPIALAGEYRLVEAEDAIPSHDPMTFAKNGEYPAGLQERAYHRDKAEQAKVMRNAQRMKPGFLINTNPDALNGPPIVDEAGIVLGGNSRAMSMQRVYGENGAKADELRSYLRENAYQMGLTAEDVDAMKNPVLVRVVSTADEDPSVLVRAMNESFIQGMDPRTMQVAMGRRLDDKTLQKLADTMQPDQTLRAYLDSQDAKGFISDLSKAGVIDDRNRSQYIEQKTGKLNEDGKTLVERILVGRLVEDPDLLSNTKPSMVGALARAVPYMIQAESAGAGYAIRSELREALHAFNRMHAMDAAPPRGAKGKEMDAAILFTKASLRDMFEGAHPVNTDPRVEAVFDSLVRRGGPRQIAATFRAYAEQAQANPEGQETMFGDRPSPAEVFNRAVAGASKKEKTEGGGDRGTPDLFAASIKIARDGLDALKRTA
jgi:hypothetical protein